MMHSIFQLFSDSDVCLVCGKIFGVVLFWHFHSRQARGVCRLRKSVTPPAVKTGGWQPRVLLKSCADRRMPFGFAKGDFMSLQVFSILEIFDKLLGRTKNMAFYTKYSVFVLFNQDCMIVLYWKVSRYLLTMVEPKKFPTKEAKRSEIVTWFALIY